MIEVPEKYVVRYTNEGVDRTWVRSTFPHPLITVDHNEADEVYAVTVVVPAGAARAIGGR